MVEFALSARDAAKKALREVVVELDLVGLTGEEAYNVALGGAAIRAIVEGPKLVLIQFKLLVNASN